MNRENVIAAAAAYFDDGRFREVLERRVAHRTESQDPASGPRLRAYLDDEMRPFLERLGFECLIVPNPVEGRGPFLLARRHEPDAAFTVLTYGHGDVVRGYDDQWRPGLSPWHIVADGDRWYGRGTADNKGQHSINFAALEQVIAARGGRLGYDVKLVLEMGEESGSPGLAGICREYRDWLAADVFLASDGPRLSADRATLFLGSRGVFNFDLVVDLREGAHHSGNWGGLLRNPAIRLAHVIASLVDAHGRILVEGLRPPRIPEAVKQALADLEVGAGPGPAVDPGWGEPGLSAAEKVFGWNSLEVLAFTAGNPDKPAHAIPPRALAHCHMRFVVGSDADHFAAHIRRHLDAHGFDDVALVAPDVQMAATRLDPEDPWVRWALASMKRTLGRNPALLPNLGGSLPNDVFAGILGLPTLWVPHSYPACSQHAPDEHILTGVTRESLQIMAGLFWDLAEEGRRVMQERAA